MKNIRMLVLFAAIALAGCDMASDMGEMMSKMETVNSALKSELGMDAQVGWNIHNGTLSQITVIIPDQNAGDRSVQELKDLTYPIVRKHFEEDPLVYQLVVAFPMKQ